MSKKKLLEQLAEELLLEKPREAFVVQSMKSLGLPEERDPIVRLEIVLNALRGTFKPRSKDMALE